jgi:hypothetical protein
MKPEDARGEVDAWMGSGDVPEADWAPYLLKLAARGDLAQASRTLLVDLPALEQPHACQTHTCTPGMRAPRSKSCCADLEVSISAEERLRIEAAMPEVAAFLARDPRWPVVEPFVGEGDAASLARVGGRCVFAVLETSESGATGGIRCGLHQLEDATGRRRGALKPVACRLFPLAIVDLGDGRRLLTAVHRSTARLLGAPSARVFPCLRLDRAAASPMWREMQGTVTAMFGVRAWKAIERAMGARSGDG